MERQVEVGIFDPHRHVEPERHLDEAVSPRRHEVQARFDQRVHALVERGRVALSGIGNGGRVEHRDGDDLHVSRRRLERQERRVQTAQPLHRTSCDPCIVGLRARPSEGQESRGARDWLVAISWVFLGLSIWGAAWTWVSFRPPRRPGLLMMVGFFAAWSTTELAPLHVLWQFAAVLIFIALGALESWAGWVGLAITLASWGFLTVKVQGAWQTDQVFRASARRHARSRAPAAADGGTVDPRAMVSARASVPLQAERRPPCPESPIRRRRSDASTPPRRVLPRRRHRGRARAPADPRWRLDDRQQESAGLAAHVSPRRAGLGLRRDQLPPLAARRRGPTISSIASTRWRGSGRTSPSTAAIPTTWSSPAAPRADI